MRTALGSSPPLGCPSGTRTGRGQKGSSPSLGVPEWDSNGRQSVCDGAASEASRGLVSQSAARTELQHLRRRSAAAARAPRPCREVEQKGQNVVARSKSECTDAAMPRRPLLSNYWIATTSGALSTILPDAPIANDLKVNS